MMGQVWAFMNLKGGVGKTTLAANLVRAVSEQARTSALLVDTDPQCSLSLIFLSDEELENVTMDKTFLDILTQDSTNHLRRLQRCTKPLSHNASWKIDLVPSHAGLIGPMISSMLAGLEGGTAARFQAMEQRFVDTLRAAKAAYGLVVLDTNPSGNIATYLAVKYADFIVAPVSNDRFSIRGITLIRDVFATRFEWLRREPWRMIPVINRVKDAKDAARVRQQLKQKADDTFGDEALIEPIYDSGFLRYDESKSGFAADRNVMAWNRSKHARMSQNLRSAADEMIKKTGLRNEEKQPGHAVTAGIRIQEASASRLDT